MVPLRRVPRQWASAFCRPLSFLLVYANQYAAGSALSLFGAGTLGLYRQTAQGQARRERRPGIPCPVTFHRYLFAEAFAAHLGVRRLGADRCGLVLPFQRVWVWCCALSASRRESAFVGYPVPRSDSAVVFGRALFAAGAYLSLFVRCSRRHDGWLR